MDYWKEAEKIYTDLERKGYRMEFESGSVDGYGYSNIRFREKDAKLNGIILTIRFNFQIEELLKYANIPWELVDEFIHVELFAYQNPEAKQLYDYMINEFEYHSTEISHFLRIGNQCGDPIKMFHFYVTVAQKHYSSIFSKARKIVIEEG